MVLPRPHSNTQFVVPGPAAGEEGDDDDEFRFSLGTQPAGTPAAVTPAIAVAASDSAGAVASDPADGAFDHDKASAFLEKLSAVELRTVMRVLHIRGRMQANTADKRAVALVSMAEQHINDEELEAMIDDVDLAAPSTLRRGVPVTAGVAAPTLWPSLTQASSGGGCSAASGALAVQAPPMAVGRGPAFSGNDWARLAHFMTDPTHFGAVQSDNQPLSRAELDKPREGLWEALLAPAFNNPDYMPTRVNPVDEVLLSDLRGMDPTRFTCRRDASKLESISRAVRSNYTKDFANYTRSGQLEGGIFKDYIKGDHQLLYLHCLLFNNPWVDFVLRMLPQAAQAEVGLPGSAAAGRGPGHPGSATPASRKRGRQAEMTIAGIDGLTAALVGMGSSAGADGRDASGRRAADAFDNAEAMGAVWKQLKDARAAVAEDPSDMIAISMRAHFETQLEKLMETD